MAGFVGFIVTGESKEMYDARIREKAITEFAEAVKGKYPHFVEDVGFVEANKMLHCNIDEIATELKGE